MPLSDKKHILRNILTYHTFNAIWEIITEVLIHRRIWRENKLLGFMHMSFAFGWFMLIITGWLESSFFNEGKTLPIWQHIFFKFFEPGEHTFQFASIFKHLMDFWLGLILTGQLVAILKRFFYKRVGIKIRTRHSRFNRNAMLSLWFIFPLRLLAESVTSAIYGGGGFLTGTIGNLMSMCGDISILYYPLWWAYSLALCTFFICIPFSRYLHIPIEGFLILARHWRISDISTINKLETMACSACGICLSNCPLARKQIAGIQPVYFIERLRENRQTDDDAWKCLQCGQCQQICPVRVHSTNLRQQIKGSVDRIDFGTERRKKTKVTRVTLFSGCMGKLTPRTRLAMEKILDAAGIKYTFIDDEKDLCCGRPLRFNGNKEAADAKFDQLRLAIIQTIPEAIVTTCPICFNMMKNRFGNIQVYHHTEFIKMLLDTKAIEVERGTETLTYHDPCELSRLAQLSRQPQKVLERVAILRQPKETGAKTRCCGGALSAIGLNNEERTTLANDTATYLSECQSNKIVTACPLCKKTIAQKTAKTVVDFAEIIADALYNNK